MQQIEQLLPQNVEVEESVLCTCFIDPVSIENILEILTVEDFYKTAHQIIYKTILKLYSEKKPIDITTIIAELKNAKKLKQIGGAVFFNNLLENVPIATNISYYCKLIKDASIKRKLIEKSYRIIDRCHSEEIIEKIIDEAQKSILEIDYNYKIEDESIKELILNRIDNYEKLSEQKEKITGLKTGFVDIDFLTCGLQSSDLIILAARPSMGKTALALNILLNTAKLNNAVLIYSLEMSKEQLCDRFFAIESGVGLMRLRSGRINKDHWEKINNAGSKIYSLPIYINDVGGLHYRDLIRSARKAKKNYDIKLIIIDYLQLLRTDKESTRDREIATMGSGLKAAAKELKIPFLIISQLNRALEQRSDKRPVLSDLRDSGSLEQDADIVSFLYRDEVYNNDEDVIGDVELLFAKHRNGPTGIVKMKWRENITRFYSVSNDN
jgi:replicative DNA helicase